MKRLLIMRHADATAGGDDFERPLSETGLRAAHDMAQRLVAGGIGVDAIVSSSATRAMQTAVCLRDGLTAANASPVDFHTTDDLYNAPVSNWVRTVSQLLETWDDVLMVGHNPAVAEMASQLSDDVVGAAPATIVDVRLPSWGELLAGRVADVWRPAD